LRDQRYQDLSTKMSQERKLKRARQKSEISSYKSLEKIKELNKTEKGRKAHKKTEEDGKKGGNPCDSRGVGKGSPNLLRETSA